MVVSRFIALLHTACCLLPVMAGAQLARPVPPVHGTLLTGAAVNLPDDLHGRTAVLVIGFTQGSRPQVADWGKRLAAEYAGSTRVRWFEVAELESVPRLLRGLVIRKVKESVSERGRQTFLIVSDHEKEWKQVVRFETPDDAYVVVVDSSGQVRALEHGQIDGASFERVKATVRTTLLAR